MSIEYIHLDIHSEYSLIDSIIRIEELLSLARDNQMPALALTDCMNMFAAIKFYQAAMQAGIKPILGSQVRIANEADPERPFILNLFCQNEIGYQNLMRLISRAYLEGQVNGVPQLQNNWLTIDSVQGLIGLSGGLQGDVGWALSMGKYDLANKFIAHWQTLFADRYYLEVTRVGAPQEEAYIQDVLTLALDYSVPVVATNQVRFLQKEDFEVHEARECIQQGRVLNDSNRPKKVTGKQYFRTSAEMQTLFADMPEALLNSVQIAKRCNLTLSLGKVCLPKFPIPGNQSESDYLTELARGGLQQRLNRISNQTEERIAEYHARLNREISVICDMGFAGYFLIVADFIRWAKENGIPVGPGRGSGAGSLVAYALKITDLDPIALELLFERFLNPERVSMPDFDIDFCMDRRDEVIDYVANLYGKGAVSQIITFGTMAARAVVRDVGRVLGYPYGFVDKIAKLLPFELGITLEKALAQEPLLKERYDTEEEVQTLMDLAQKLEGLTRNAGKHAGGVVISPSALTDFTPLYCEPGSTHAVTQYDKDDIETVGLVKFDFLGLRTLTIMDWAVQSINVRRKKNAETPLQLEYIPLDDVATYQLLKSCATTAVFQLESRGMKELIHRLQPDCFEEIIALVALYRPGPLQSGMVDDFIARKHKLAEVSYAHPKLAPILAPTYGVILYQEQVMQIAQELAGYTLGGADILRRAMGKKKPEEMASQRQVFLTGATERGVSAEQATYIFDLMEKFAGYGFNKSHSAAYALIAYQTAWLKAHFAAEFMAAVLSSDMDHTDKVVLFIEECSAMKLSLSGPDINRSEYRFYVDEHGAIIYGLGAIKGVGEAAIANIVEERNQNGPFRDLFSLCQRVDCRRMNRRVLTALIQAGALDGFSTNRASLLASSEKALALAEQKGRSLQHGLLDLFAESELQNPEDSALVTAPEWSLSQRLQAEKEVLGFYFSGHPLENYQEEISSIADYALNNIKPTASENVWLVGMVYGVRQMLTKRMEPMGFITLSDRTGRVEMAVFPEPFQQYRELFVKDAILVVCVQVQVDPQSKNVRLSCRRVLSMREAREEFIPGILLQLEASQASEEHLNVLSNLLKPYLGGSLPIYIHYIGSNAETKLSLGSAWRVVPTDELLIALRGCLGADKVKLISRKRS